MVLTLLAGILAVGSALAQTPLARSGPSQPGRQDHERQQRERACCGCKQLHNESSQTRIEARGFSNVSGLKKDKSGVWRGKAEKEGQPKDVSVDFQGNVISEREARCNHQREPLLAEQFSQLVDGLVEAVFETVFGDDQAACCVVRRIHAVAVLRVELFFCSQRRRTSHRTACRNVPKKPGRAVRFELEGGMRRGTVLERQLGRDLMVSRPSRSPA